MDTISQAFGRTWRGETSLPITFWLYGAVGSIAFKLLFLSLLIASEHSPMFPFLFLLFIVGGFGYSIFLWVATWRSAGNYIEQFGGLRSSWGYLARFCVILGILGTLGQCADAVPK